MHTLKQTAYLWLATASSNGPFCCVYENKGGSGYLLDVQSNIFSGLNTRVVVPLLPKPATPLPAHRLNPIFSLEGQELVMATQYMAAIPEKSCAQM